MARYVKWVKLSGVWPVTDPQVDSFDGVYNDVEDSMDLGDATIPSPRSDFGMESFEWEVFHQDYRDEETGVWIPQDSERYAIFYRIFPDKASAEQFDIMKALGLEDPFDFAQGDGISIVR